MKCPKCDYNKCFVKDFNKPFFWCHGCQMKSFTLQGESFYEWMDRIARERRTNEFQTMSLFE